MNVRYPIADIVGLAGNTITYRDARIERSAPRSNRPIDFTSARENREAAAFERNASDGGRVFALEFFGFLSLSLAVLYAQ